MESNYYKPVQIMVDPNDWKEFRRLCQHKELTMRLVLGNLIKGYLEIEGEE
jgi:hypothetical protein